MNVLQIVGYKNAGKTTATAAMIARLTELGYSVGAIKHDAHGFQPDVPGTDSWRHREAGAYMTAITSEDRTAWTIERPSELDELLDEMRHNGADAVIVEGFKSAAHPKLVLLRGEDDAGLLGLANIVAIAVREPNAYVRAEAERLQKPYFVIGDHQFAPLLAFIETQFVSR